METVWKVQEKALKITSRLKGESYEERCKEVGLETPDERKKSQDLAQVFKIVEGIYELDSERIFSARRQYQNTRMSAKPWNLTSKQAQTDLRK
jgi:hypothetical protein